MADYEYHGPEVDGPEVDGREVGSPKIHGPEAEPALANVLLVDDREDDLELTRIALFRRPRLCCHLHTARDGREGYDMLVRNAELIDLVLLDINMPDVNGFELLEQIRRNEKLRHIQVVMCSGSDDERDRRRALRLGAAGYLLKPPRYGQLKEIVDRLPGLCLHQNGAAASLTRAGTGGEAGPAPFRR